MLRSLKGGSYVIQTRSPLIGVVRNLLSHRYRAEGRKPEYASPEYAGNVLIREPASHEALREVLFEFLALDIDYLVVEGGDGTVRDVLTWGADVFGEAWPPIILLPRGKTNALVADLRVPNGWSLQSALDAAACGNLVSRRPLSITLNDIPDRKPAPGERAIGPGSRVHGFFLGAGAFGRGTETAQSMHSHSMFGGVAVVLTVLWSVLQIVFGSARNRWRSNSPMRLRYWPGGRPVSHSEPRERNSRFLLVASTLTHFPAGMRPFGSRERLGIHLAIIDRPRRWLLAMLPIMAFGGFLSRFSRHGTHRLNARAFEMEFGEAFIVDGEAFPPGSYIVQEGPELTFVAPLEIG